MVYAYGALTSGYIHAFWLYPHDLARSSIVNPHVWSYPNSLQIHISLAWSLYAILLQDTCKFKSLYPCLINLYMLCYMTARRFLNVPLPWMNATPLFISPLIVDSCMFTPLPSPTLSIMCDKFVYSSNCLLDVCMLGSYRIFANSYDMHVAPECLCQPPLFCFIYVRFPWLYSTYMVPLLHTYAVPTYLCHSNLFCSHNRLPVPTCCPLWFLFHDWDGFHTDYFGSFVYLSIITTKVIEMAPLMVSLLFLT